MTRQTSAPLDDFRKDVTHTTMRELVRSVDDNWLVLDPPYQRGAVWTLDQQLGLIRSWLTGLPIPAIILNDRTSSWWTGPSPRGNSGNPLLATVDGQQRLRTGLAWFHGELLAPATWFPAEYLTVTEDTDDGPYVRYTGMAKPLQLDIAFHWTVPVVTAKVASVEAEAEIYLLVNGGGVPQTADDMARAAAIAAGGTT